jgi:uncharacterized protein YecE (DUF72 family)
MKTSLEYRIGAGGWAYFRIPEFDSLSAYSAAFDFVEVNSTFYESPSLVQVAIWRQKVPDDFEFSVRCHKDLTHKNRLEPTQESHRILSENIQICNTLRASIMQIQTPQSFNITKQTAVNVRDLLSSVNSRGVRIAWEIRSIGQGKCLPDFLKKTMQDLDMIHCVDLSNEDPAYSSDIIYTRLFGKGRHNIYQFDDKELKQIHEKVRKSKEKKVVLSFHGLKMYLDAARFKVYNEKLTFPPVTKSVGLSSLREVLSEDTRFPSTKEALIEHEGWRVFDMTPTERIHSSEILVKLPDKTYTNLDEVIAALRASNPSS